MVNRAATVVMLGMATSACAAVEPAAVTVGEMRSGGATEQTVLRDVELDTVTAAAVLVDVASIASAHGDLAKIKTDAKTFAFDGDYFDVGVGLTTGQAFACCGEDAEVEVGSAVLGIGDIVHGVTQMVEHDNRVFAEGLSTGFVLALSFEEHFAQVQGGQLKVPDKHLVVYEELRAGLTAFDIKLPDAVGGSNLSSYRSSQIAGAQ